MSKAVGGVSVQRSVQRSAELIVESVQVMKNTKSYAVDLKRRPHQSLKKILKWKRRKKGKKHY